MRNITDGYTRPQRPILRNLQVESRRPIRVVAALLAWLCLGPFAAHANDFFWQRDSGGDWFANGNWSGGPNPTSFSDTATFTKNNHPGSPAPAPVNLLSVGPDVPTIGILNLNVRGYTFQNGTLQLGGPATINVQSRNPFADFAANATIQLFSNATINTSLADSTLSVAGGGNYVDLSLLRACACPSYAPVPPMRMNRRQLVLERFETLHEVRPVNQTLPIRPTEILPN